MKNIILIGFMGVGKSEVGKALAKRLHMTYIDTDSMIEKSEKKSISNIFVSLGEKHFRDLETKVVDKISKLKNRVISTGGGMVLREENVTKLKKLGPLVLLHANAEVIERRLSKADDRPLLQVDNKSSKIKELLDNRDPIYNAVADFSVDTSDISVAKAVDLIVRFIEKVKK